MPGKKAGTRRCSPTSSRPTVSSWQANRRFERPRDPQWAFLITGYCECIDSFFAFGLFELARRSGFFPAELVETFEPVIQEECRHILLFANLVAWQRANLPWWRRLYFELRVAAVWAVIAWERIVLARSMDAKGDNKGDKHVSTAPSPRAAPAPSARSRSMFAIS